MGVVRYHFPLPFTLNQIKRLVEFPVGEGTFTFPPPLPSYSQNKMKQKKIKKIIEQSKKFVAKMEKIVIETEVKAKIYGAETEKLSRQSEINIRRLKHLL